jgi:hypothetical protein
MDDGEIVDVGGVVPKVPTIIACRTRYGSERRGGRRQRTVRCCRAKWDAYRVCYLRVPEGLIIELASE